MNSGIYLITGNYPGSQLYTASYSKIKIFLCFFIFTLFFYSFPTPGSAVQNRDFPTYTVIKPNVFFWEKIYGHYSQNEAVVHDKNNLSIIYEVIPNLNNQLPGAARINKAYRKKILKKYKTILQKIVIRGKPLTPEEKRIFNLFPKIDRLKKIETAADNIRIQDGLKEKFREGVVRSGKYLNEIQRVFLSYGLPVELAYLPHVESSFINNAHSKAGAQGIWQFTRSTGKQFLKINSNIDERKDPILAADAAARYLKKSYNELGNWPLAISSYNYGIAGMKRALQAQGSYPKIFTEYQKGYFKFASRNFYPEFIAACNIAKKLETSKTLRTEKPQKCYYQSLPGYISVAAIARAFKLPDRIIAEYNPALLKPTLKGEKYIPKGYRLRLPRTRLTQQGLRAIPPAAFAQKQKKGKYYIVRKGDTAGAIAYRHKLSLTRLSKMNNLGSAGIIYVGQKLRLQ